MTDWVEWHTAYDNPSSSLSRRLNVVRQRLEGVLVLVDRASPSILSLCAGNGGDVIPVLATNRSRWSASALLIELDPALAASARAAAGESGLGCVDVRCGDAADPSMFVDAAPVDVLLLCGIFGNIRHESFPTVVGAIPLLVRQHGYVIWTRGAARPSEPDRRPEVRRWFRDAGLPEVAFDGEPEVYGVGLNEVTAPASGDIRLMAPLFEFVSVE